MIKAKDKNKENNSNNKKSGNNSQNSKDNKKRKVNLTEIFGSTINNTGKPHNFLKTSFKY